MSEKDYGSDRDDGDDRYKGDRRGRDKDHDENRGEVALNIARDGAVESDLGDGDNVVEVSGNKDSQVRATFTSAEVGDGNPNDSNSMMNQDGGLAVRLQAENGDGTPTGPISRFDDEGITFDSDTRGLTFDVRDLVSGAARGDQFDVVRLGTKQGDDLDESGEKRSYYINAGMGDDTVTGGRRDDFLVGGAGNDTLEGGRGDDTLLGGGGNDTAIFNVSRDGTDSTDLGAGSDVVLVDSKHGGQVRLTFTSADIGNGAALDGGDMMNEDNGLAVRFQLEDGAGTPDGNLSRFDDEGITFVSAQDGLTFDVRDLPSGTARGDQFEVVRLGTEQGELLDSVQAGRPYYINAGAGDDTVSGGNRNDFLVGGAGSDTITGGLGDDGLLGGGGNDTAIVNAAQDGADNTDLGAGSDVVLVDAKHGSQVRLTFTSADVGNAAALDGNNMMNEDGGLAVRFQLENGANDPDGPLSRYDDEGITFVAAQDGLTFDVRDLPSGTARGDQFEVVRLGTEQGELLDSVQAGRPYYINAGAGDDTVSGGNRNDFLVGGAGNDTIIGGLGNDSLLGGGGNDTFAFDTGLDAAINVDTILDFNANADKFSLDNAVFLGLPEGNLDANAFALSGAMAENDDRIIYDQTTRSLSFDADGGTRDNAVDFATLINPAAPPSFSDFIVV